MVADGVHRGGDEEIAQSLIARQRVGADAFEPLRQRGIDGLHGVLCGGGRVCVFAGVGQDLLQRSAFEQGEGLDLPQALRHIERRKIGIVERHLADDGHGGGQDIGARFGVVFFIERFVIGSRRSPKLICRLAVFILQVGVTVLFTQILVVVDRVADDARQIFGIQNAVHVAERRVFRIDRDGLQRPAAVK